MKRLIKLTPLEPYFFGGERIFEFDGGNKHYFIRSLNTPSQTALFGVLRFLGCKPNNDWELTTEDKDNVGSASFNLKAQGPQSFGRINYISPLYIVDSEGNYYVRTPFDHKVNSQEKYTPFEISCTEIQTVGTPRKFPKRGEYDPKAGIADSWLCLNDMTLRANLFKGVVRVGINKGNKEKGFVKKEFKQLEQGFSFAFIADVADVEDNFILHTREVFIGQGKSTFSVSVTDELTEPCLGGLAQELRPGTIYAQSDMYYAEGVAELYNECNFVCVKTRDYRVFTTKYGAANARERYLKKEHGSGITLIQAGSIFIPNNVSCIEKKISNEHARIAGFNNIIIGEDKSDAKTSIQN